MAAVYLLHLLPLVSDCFCYTRSDVTVVLPTTVNDIEYHICIRYVNIHFSIQLHCTSVIHILFKFSE